MVPPNSGTVTTTNHPCRQVERNVIVEYDPRSEEEQLSSALMLLAQKAEEADDEEEGDE